TDGRDKMRGALLGPEPDDDTIATELRACGAVYQPLAPETVPDAAAQLIAGQNVVGWIQGPMEFGPRALGARSILADARSPRMQSLINLKIKFRESFRPFAPAVLREEVGRWFELETDSPYMLLVAAVRPERRRAMTDAEQA